MKVFQAVSLVLLATVAVVHASERGLRSSSPVPNELEKERRLMGDMNTGGGGGGGAGNQVDPNNPPKGCVRFNVNGAINPNIESAIAHNHVSHAAECNTEVNSCIGSAGTPMCCKFHPNLLRCDSIYNGEFDSVPVSQSIHASILCYGTLTSCVDVDVCVPFHLGSRQVLTHTLSFEISLVYLQRIHHLRRHHSGSNSRAYGGSNSRTYSGSDSRTYFSSDSYYYRGHYFPPYFE
jgi:hypothetical protein